MAKNKRTPKGKIDDARKSADADWEVEKIVAVATGKDGNRYLVRWKGYAEKHGTYEPKKDLAGAKKLLEVSVRGVQSSVQRRPVPMQK